MKVTKPMIIAALVAGNLFAWNLALRADDSTNTPPADNHGSGMRGRPDFAKELNLTDDQKPKFKAIMDAQMQKMRDLRQDDSLSQDDRRTKMKAIHDDTATQLKTVLTADQFAKWQKMSQHWHRPPPDGENGAGTPPPDAPPQN
jgi:Spy/CpxP family protein refolding chaperone